MKAQTIQIDSNFTSDGEIFPFSPNDTIYGLSITGFVSLLSDTSLVRVILSDNAGNEWMVYEAYPMINPNWEIDLSGVADETMCLQISNPNSVIIQIIDASIYLENLILQNDITENLGNLQENHKNFIEDKKVDSISFYITSNEMLWFANRTQLSDFSYSEKQDRYGEKFNLEGWDFYTGGVYDFIPGCTGPVDNSDLVDSWDWRSRHGANDPEKSQYYYDNDPLGTGWLTSVKDQEKDQNGTYYLCDGLCYIYGPLGALEGVANLYFNDHKDYNLSEQQVLDCDADNSFDQCEQGQADITNNYALETGLVSESCYPRIDAPETCNLENIPLNERLYQLKPSNAFGVNHTSNDFIKEALIQHGPLSVLLANYAGKSNHYVVLVGYKELEEGDKFLQNPNYGNDSISISASSPYIGQLMWIFKNSFGPQHDFYGFSYELDENFHPYQVKYYQLPIDDILTEFDTIIPSDKDKDGYWNWGISEEFDLPESACSSLKDSDDSEKRIGHFDEEYYGVPVKPQMIVTAGPSNTPVTNHGFYFMGPQSQQTITITISNPGNAQLNIVALYPVTITQDGTDFLLINNPAPKICMGGENFFQISFDTHSPDEFQKALISIQLAQCDNDIYDHFEFALVYHYNCDFNENVYWVTGYESWDDDEYILMNQNIFIDDGATLEVFGSVAMNEESNILIAAGGQLIINGGLITGSCETSWFGIDIWGDPNQPQTLVDQGKVSVINGGCIEYAETAIETARLDGYGRYNPSGGIISCTDAIFKDNVTDINFYPYRNYNPYNYQTLPNFSRINRTRFETTDDFYALFSVDPNTHVFLDEVLGINFTGCSFGNNSSPANDSRGKGIESYGAGYHVFDACINENTYPCPGTVNSRFENLEYGIRAFNSNSFNPITVDLSDFYHNLRAIHFRLVDNPTIIKNHFDITDPDGLWTNQSLVGLYLDEFTTGFVVEENSFEGEPTYPSIFTYGIYLLNVDTTYNEIYNNNFVNLRRGIQAQGDNRNADTGNGVCFKCNDFTGCQTDIVVTYDEIITDNTGIALFQGRDGNGDPTWGAGNRFSNVYSYNYINDAGCNHIDYTYQASGSSPPYLVPDYSGDFTLNPDGQSVYSKETSCPSHLGGSITLSLEMNSLAEEIGYIASYQDTLSNVIDGGNTEGLNLDVLTSFPEEALAIRQELLDESPYLSDTVLISTIEKEDVLPAAMVRDILAQNPQAPKSNKVLNALDNRLDTLPGYMMDEIMEGLDTYGAKEILEQKLGEHMAKRDKAWNNINLYFKNDTANVGPATDSLIAVYEDANMLSEKYTLALMYLDQHDSANAFNVLDNIPVEYNLSSQESTTHENYQALFDILWDVKNDTTGLDSLQIQTLFELSSDLHSVPGLYAANLLIKERLLNYYEPVRLVDITKSALINEKGDNIPKTNKHLTVFPNPAGNYFIVAYELPNPDISGLITISDIHGKKLKNFILKDLQNQIVIPADEFAAGAYIISLFNGNHVIDTQKLTISN